MTDEKQTTESKNQASVNESDDTTIFDFGVENESDSQDTDEIGPEKVETKEDVKEVEAKTETETETETDSKPINQEAIDKKINKLTFKRYEEQRKREEAEKRLQEAEKKLEEFQKPESGELKVPEYPDVYDPDFDQKVIERDEILKKNSEIRALKKLEADKLLQEKAKAQQAIAEDTRKRQVAMYDKAAELGFDEDEFKQNDIRVATVIRDLGVQDFILKSDDSTLIVQYLAQNFPEMEKISQMDTVSAAVHITTNVIPQAKQLKPSTTKTPDPLDIPTGRGGGEKQSQYLEGVQME